MLRQIVGIFGVFFIGERGGFGDVPKRVAAQDVTIGGSAEEKIAVIGAGDGELCEEGGIVDLSIADFVTNVEHVI